MITTTVTITCSRCPASDLLVEAQSSAMTRFQYSVIYDAAEGRGWVRVYDETATPKWLCPICGGSSE